MRSDGIYRRISAAITGILLLMMFGIFVPVYADAEETVSIYARPAEIVFPDEDEGLSASSRRWQGVSGVEITRGGRIWSTFLTGGEKEPSIENYVVYSYSDDGGKTWADPFFAIVHPDENVRTIDPSLWLAKDGSLWCMYTVASTSDPALQTGLFGGQETWRVRIENPDADAQGLRAQLESAEPEFMSKGMKFNKIISLDNGELMYFASNNPASRNIFVYVSSDNGKSFSLRSTIAGASSDGAQYSLVEPMGIQTEEGKIRVLARIQLNNGAVIDGGLGCAESEDNGHTWTAFKGNLSAPMGGTVSRFAYYKLQSGNILFVYHDSLQNDRTNLTAWLSEDGGKTFPYKLLLDGRANVSYPDVTQDGDGNIYVQYDRGRNTQSEIRLCVFSEQDIRNGYFSSDCAVRLRVSVLGSLNDITGVTTGFLRDMQANPGVAMKDIRSKLPEKVEVVASDGASYTLEGVWDLSRGSLEEGVAVLSFTATTDFIRYNLFDAHDLLTVRVHIRENTEDPSEENHLFAVVAGVIGGCVAVGAVIGVIVVLRRKKNTHAKQEKMNDRADQ